MKTITTFLTSTLLSLFVIGGIMGCSSSTTPPAPTTATVHFTGETDGMSASKAFWGKSPTITAGTQADSIEITRVRFLLSAVKLHVQGNDTTTDGQVETGPFVAEFTPGLSRTFTTVTVPSGTYAKFQFGIYQFPTPVAALYSNDPVFTDFVTAERATVIIEGKVWPPKIAVPVDFVYKSHITANAEAAFQGVVTLSLGSTNTLAMIFSPKLAFKAAFVLDPRDPLNSAEIDGFLTTSMTAMKR